MTVWKPELTPAVRSKQETMLEWQERSFRKISNWSAQVADALDSLASHGGLDILSSTTALNGTIPITSTKIPGSAYEAESSSSPVNVIQDLTNGELIINKAGFWNVSFGLVCEVDGFTANDTANIALGIYNETLSASAEVPVTASVPRYGTYFTAVFTGNYEVPEARVGDRLSLHWVQVDGPTLTVLNTYLLHFTVSMTGIPGYQAG